MIQKLFWVFLILWFSTKSHSQSNSIYHYEIPPQLKDGWQTASLSDVKLDSTKITELTHKILDNSYINVHSLLIIRNDKLVYENYFPGYEDPSNGDTSLIYHDRDYIHECRSISKSVVSACIGIAIAQGKIKGVNEKVFQYFPEYEKYDEGMKSEITIKDLLTMKSGIQWYEGDSASVNQEVSMMRSNNPVEYFFKQPMAEPPGKIWNYNGGCTQVLGEIINKVTGVTIDSFANKNIFIPLGIPVYKWDKTKEGFRWCASGLRLRSRDIAKFGLLYLNQGQWMWDQIIPAYWVHLSMEYHSLAYAGDSTYYGYQFWCFADSVQGEKTKAAVALGNGGQFILVKPLEDMVVVITAGNYYDPLLELQSYYLIRDDIYPAIEQASAK